MSANRQVLYPNFDWLRLLLASEVVFLHLYWQLTNQPIFVPFPSVPGFLALSGFLVLQSWETSKSGWHFFRKRILRVMPAFFASLMLVGVLFGFKGVKDSLSNYLTFGFRIPLYTNGPLWSLSSEEVAYITLAVLACVGVYRRWPWLIACAFFASLGLIMFDNPVGDKIHRILPLPAAFFLGNLVYLYRERLQSFAVRYGYYVVAIALVLRIGEAYWWGFTGDSVRIPVNPVFWALAVFALLLIGISRTGGARIPADISYGIYIYHWPIMKLFYDSGMRSAWLYPFCIGFTVLLSIFSWYALEQPFLKLKNRALSISGILGEEVPVPEPST